MGTSKFKYKLFSLYIPSILAILSLTFTGLGFGGQTRQAKAAKEVYLLQFDFWNINFTSIVHPTNETNNELSSLKRFHYIGLWNHCESRVRSSSRYYYCTGKDASYQYDLYNIIERDAFNYRTRRYIGYLSLPNDITPSKPQINLVFAGVCISVVFLVISTILLIGLIVFCKDKPGGFIITSIAIATIFLGLSVGMAQHSYQKVIDNFSNVYEEYGIDASFGNKKFYSFLWVSFVFELFSFIMIIVSNSLFKKADKRGDFNKDYSDQERTRPTSEVRTSTTANNTRINLPQGNPDANGELPPKYEDINNHRAPKPPTFFRVTPEGVIHRYSSAN